MACFKESYTVESSDEFNYSKEPAQHNSDLSNSRNEFYDLASPFKDVGSINGFSYIEENIDSRPKPSFEPSKTPVESVSIHIELPNTELRT